MVRKRHFSRWWDVLVNVVTIATLFGINAGGFISDPIKAYISLVLLVLLVLFIGWRVYATLKNWQEKVYPKGFIPISTFIRYTTLDGKNITHESYKLIQIKAPFLKKFVHRYYWTGTNKPKITSAFQKIDPQIKVDPETKNSYVDLIFDQIPVFNDTEVVHIRSSIDDSDCRSQTFISVQIQEPIRMISLRVELYHWTKTKYSGSHAKIGRRLLTAGSSVDFEEIETVVFDSTAKCFEWVGSAPEPGYAYKISWNRDGT